MLFIQNSMLIRIVNFEWDGEGGEAIKFCRTTLT